MAENPRKDPYQVRRSSKSEFSRVTAMLKEDIKSLAERVALLEVGGNDELISKIEALEKEVEALKKSRRKKEEAE